MMSIHEASLDDDGDGDGGDPETVDPTKLGELAALQGVVKFPVRIKCATLELEHARPGAGRARRH